MPAAAIPGGSSGRRRVPVFRRSGWKPSPLGTPARIGCLAERHSSNQNGEKSRRLKPNAASFFNTWDSCSNGGADPLVRAGRPRPALLSKNQALPEPGRPARGPAADEGVRPTIYADARLWEKLAALGFSLAEAHRRLKSAPPRQLSPGSSERAKVLPCLQGMAQPIFPARRKLRGDIGSSVSRPCKARVPAPRRWN